ncbi:glycoside hydrolase family 6 protein [Microbacterium sp. ABRD28]|uniref:glycoside hydrolase family 6 protein n=1 Tax=Microbacterium sp. ABRD28 TaxID=2268461 RepID=UPI000F554209|nr:glycoside hydrolase family 6 protein [Microbacterium sp. ABRD28]AZC13161.1 glycoside hydrolase family 6 [Microbacterium sp. ABRD28]
MRDPFPRRRMPRVVTTAIVAVVTAAMVVPASAATANDRPPAAPLHSNPFSTTLQAAQGLTGQARTDAQLLGSIPSAEWFTGGTPEEVRARAAAYVDTATSAGETPVLVAYNLPFRDCEQYSAGGATDTAAYTAWIAGLAAGIGSRPAIVILEPDGLGVIPYYTTIGGVAEWCRPVGFDSKTAAADRFAQFNSAVDTLGGLASTSVYLDGTHSDWLSVADITDRLLKAGVQRASGFFLNASNFQFTANVEAFGRWVSSCLTYVTKVKPGGFSECGDQKWNGGPATGWSGVAMTNTGQWSAGATDPALNTAGVDSRYASILAGVQPTTPFVIDTSRNGKGPWQPPAGTYRDPEVWCNPPGRGVGARPTMQTGKPLVDGYLWIKVPGESDGLCFRGTGGPLDPSRGVAGPAAGAWFPAQARELVSLAQPTLAPLTCTVTVDVTRSSSGFSASMVVRNDSTQTLRSWALRWNADPTQQVRRVIPGTFIQQGSRVTVTPPLYLASLAPGKTTKFSISGVGAATEPWLARVSDKPCYTL